MKNILKKIVDAFVSNASNRMHAIGTIASTWTIALALTFGLAGAAGAATVDVATHAELVSVLAGSAETIRFTADITATKALELEDGRTVTIDGCGHVLTVPVPGANELGILNADSSTFVLFSNAGSLTVSNLTMRGGHDTCLYNTGSLKMIGCTIERTGSKSDSHGLHNEGGKCYLKDSKISRNNSYFGAGFLNKGSGYLVMDSCSLNENRSLSSSGGGGGGENEPESYLIVNNSTFANNTSTEIGGAINQNRGNTYVLNTTFVGNISDSGYGSRTGGGFGQNRGAFYAANLLMVNNYARTSSGSSSVLSDFRDCDLGIFDDGGRGTYGCGYGAVRTGDGEGDVEELDNSKHVATNDVFVGYRRFGVLNPDGSSGEALFNRPIITLCGKGTYIAPLKMASAATTDGTNTYVYIPEDVSTFSTSTIKLGVGTDESITALGAFAAAEAADKVTTYQDGTARAAGVIGAAGPTAASYATLTVKHVDNGTTTGDGSLYGDTYLQGTEVSVTAVPDAGYGPTGWLVNDEATPSVTANPYVFNLMADTVLEPVFVEAWAVTFNVLDHGEAPMPQYFIKTMTPPGKATKPADPTATGYTFGGWFTTPACRTEDTYDFNTEITADWTLYAKWTATTSGTPPPAPIVKEPSDYTPGGFTANWSETSHAIKYEVKVFEDAACAGEAVRTATNEFTSTSAAFTGLTAEGQYYYRVWAIDQSDKKSEASGIMSVRLPHSCDHGNFFTRIEAESELVKLFAKGGNGYLAADITLTDALFVGDEKSVSLCLNGHVLDLGGCRLDVYWNQSLALYDCDTTTPRYFSVDDVSGCWTYDPSLTEETAEHTLKGGLLTGSGADGAIYCSGGGLTMHGVTVAGNNAADDNVIYFSTWNKVFDLADTTVCGNRSSGAAVRADCPCTVKLGGKMTVTNNVGGANLFLYRYGPTDTAILSFDDENPLDAASVVGVTLQSGYGDFATACATDHSARFFSDNASYTVSYGAGQKLYLCTSTAATITFDANGGENPPAPITDKHIGESFTFPPAGTMTRTGYALGGWTLNGKTYAVGETSPTIESETVAVTSSWTLVITQQPAFANDYTVGVGTTDTIGYQWYKQTCMTLPEAGNYSIYEGDYDSEANVLTQTYDCMEFYLKNRPEGSILMFTSTCGDLYGDWGAGNLQKSGPVAGVYTYKLVFNNAVGVDIYGGEVGTTIENITITDMIEVAGQTTRTLTEGLVGANYACRLTYDGDLTVDSDLVEYLGPAVKFTPETVDHTTSAVYTNGAAVVKTGDVFLVPSNSTATVVYTVTEPGYYFADGTTVVTNTITTTTNPATATPPAPPATPSVKVGNLAQRYPWNGIVDVPYRLKNWPAGGAGRKVKFSVTVGATTVDAGTTVPAAGGTVIGTFAIDFKALNLPLDRGEATVKAEITTD